VSPLATIRNALCAAAAVRLALLLFGLWQDANMPVRYTDIDYVVFTDAARFMYKGDSPFERATYRYTPVLAWMLQPNIWLHTAFGKLLFVIADLIVGWIIYTDGRSRGLSAATAVAYASAWLFNPISINVSTRGNAEAVLSVLIVGWLHMLMRRRTAAAAVLYGLSVHFKLYPIIYAPAIALFINHRYCAVPYRRWYSPAELFNAQRLQFTLLSAASFIAPTAYYYRHYGWEFLWEAYLYHFARTDHRHNFSPYFYLLYLQPEHKTAIGLAALIPQLAMVLRFTISYHEDIAYCVTLITLVFVAFNKVCTVQYFVWYFCLLPFVLPASSIPLRKGLQLFAAWAGAQALWLAAAGALEMLGINTFLYIWAAGLVFFGVNIVCMRTLMTHHCNAPVLNSDGSMALLRSNRLRDSCAETLTSSSSSKKRS
jgi:phosphatidylinositol glycan class M